MHFFCKLLFQSETLSRDVAQKGGFLRSLYSQSSRLHTPADWLSFNAP
jgi:hypothetical protein